MADLLSARIGLHGMLRLGLLLVLLWHVGLVLDRNMTRRMIPAPDAHWAVV